MNNLPVEITELILKYVCVSDLPSVYRSCKLFRSIIGSDNFESKHKLNDDTKIKNEFCNFLKRRKEINDDIRSESLSVIDFLNFVNNEKVINWFNERTMFKLSLKLYDLMHIRKFDLDLICIKNELIAKISTKILKHLFRNCI
jgi:hypothetical protein